MLPVAPKDTRQRLDPAELDASIAEIIAPRRGIVRARTRCLLAGKVGAALAEVRSRCSSACLKGSGEGYVRAVVR